MIRHGTAGTPRCWCVPRRRGDDPPLRPTMGESIACSPQARGCSASLELSGVVDKVFPAGAGMIRWSSISALILSRVPRRRGDDPPVPSAFRRQHECSPRTRG
ncbi:hypothetical protein C3Y92_05820 [Solidesulfovibrio carbinolicus]|uniref:Uncharacterized protein n=1 Tax=Solidesulfovibrio carbinolicus TaxID=296842 RepID=A0A4P6HJL5_9BACT|nr:hypothetical protein C3Y92_05820 [Solidesulfovibrio carbinolicus]